MHFVRINLQRYGFIVFITFVALLLRLYKLNYWSYWDDEIITILAARPPITQIFTSLAQFSIHPPLYYMLIHLWMSLPGIGEHVVSIRLLSVIIGTACVPLLFVLGKQLNNVAVGTVAALLLALAPMHIYHSQQARMYPLMTLVIIVAMMVFWHAWHHTKWHQWLWFALVVGIGCYTHVYVPFSLMACAVWAVIRVWHKRQEWRKLLWLGAAYAIGIALFVPFVPQMMTNVHTAKEQFWRAPISPFSWLLALVENINGATLLTTTKQTFMTLLVLFIAASVFVITLFYMQRPIKQPSQQQTSIILLLHLLIWIPIGIATGISLTIKPILVNRYLIGIMPPLLLLMAWVFVMYWRAWQARLLFALYSISIVIVLAGYYPSVPQSNARVELARYLATEQQPGDAIIIPYWHMYLTTRLTQSQLEHVYVTPGEIFTPSYWQSRMAYVGIDAAHYVQPVEAIASQYQRIWFTQTIYNQDYAYQQRVTQGWLDAHGTLRATFILHEGEGTTVFLYDMH